MEANRFLGKGLQLYSRGADLLNGLQGLLKFLFAGALGCGLRRRHPGKLLRGRHVSWVDAYGLLKFPCGIVRPARCLEPSSLSQVKIGGQHARGLFVNHEEGIVGLGLHSLFKINQRRVVVLSQLRPASLAEKYVASSAREA